MSTSDNIKSRLASQDADSDCTDSTMDMDINTDDDVLISHDDIVRVSATISAQRKAKFMVDHIHNPDSTISSSAKEVMNGQDSVNEHQARLISRLTEQNETMRGQIEELQQHDRYHREHISTMETERQLAGIGDLEPPQEYQSLYRSSRRLEIQRHADNIVHGELAMAMGNVRLEKQKAALVKAESHLGQKKAILALEAVKDEIRQHRETLEKLRKEESRVEANINIQNNAHNQTNVFINSLLINNAQPQDQEAQLHTSPPAPNEPTLTIPFRPQLRD